MSGEPSDPASGGTWRDAVAIDAASDADDTAAGNLPPECVRDDLGGTAWQLVTEPGDRCDQLRNRDRAVAFDVFNQHKPQPTSPQVWDGRFKVSNRWVRLVVHETDSRGAV